MRSHLSTDRRRIVCEFEAADAESVRSAFRSARVGFTRVWTAEVFQPGGGARGDWRERHAARGRIPPDRPPLPYTHGRYHAQA